MRSARERLVIEWLDPGRDFQISAVVPTETRDFSDKRWVAAVRIYPTSGRDITIPAPTNPARAAEVVLLEWHFLPKVISAARLQTLLRDSLLETEEERRKMASGRAKHAEEEGADGM